MTKKERTELWEVFNKICELCVEVRTVSNEETGEEDEKLMHIFALADHNRDKYSK